MQNDSIKPTSDKPEGYTIPEAADRLGIEAFSLYGMIQRGIVEVKRSSTGILLLVEEEIQRLLSGSPQPQG